MGNLSCIVWKRTARGAIFPESQVSPTRVTFVTMSTKDLSLEPLTISSLILSLGFNIYSIILVT